VKALYTLVFLLLSTITNASPAAPHHPSTITTPTRNGFSRTIPQTPQTTACAQNLIALSKLPLPFPPRPIRRHIFGYNLLMIKNYDQNSKIAQRKSAALAFFHCLTIKKNNGFVSDEFSDQFPDYIKSLKAAFDRFFKNRMFGKNNKNIDLNAMYDYISQNTFDDVRDIFVLQDSAELDGLAYSDLHRCIQTISDGGKSRPFWILLYDATVQHWFCLYFSSPNHCSVINSRDIDPHPREIPAIQRMYDAVQCCSKAL
jgi:hypothetical protein